MSREHNGVSYLTTQEWLALGYPHFVAAALEGYNEQCADDSNSYDVITPAAFAARSPRDQLKFALDYEGIGYAGEIWTAVTRLQLLEAAKRSIGLARTIHKDWKRTDFALWLEIDLNITETEARDLARILVQEAKS